MAEEIVFAQVLKQMMDDRYRRNRSALADELHISVSALSQYARARATPSLDVLVQIADALDVSLDYLVFGKERVAPPPELGYLAGHIEGQLRKAQAESAALQNLTARIGVRIAETIEKAARDLVNETSSMGGTLNNSEAAALERCSSHTVIVTADMSLDVLILEFDDGQRSAAPSVFAKVVTDNVAEGSTFEFIVPEGIKWTREATHLKNEVARLGDLDPVYVDKQLKVLQVPDACIPGFVVQHVLLEKLPRRAADIANRVMPFVYRDPDDSQKGFVAYIEPGSPSYDQFGLVRQENIPRILEQVQAIKAGTKTSGE